MSDMTGLIDKLTAELLAEKHKSTEPIKSNKVATIQGEPRVAHKPREVSTMDITRRLKDINTQLKRIDREITDTQSTKKAGIAGQRDAVTARLSAKRAQLERQKEALMRKRQTSSAKRAQIGPGAGMGEPPVTTDIDEVVGAPEELGATEDELVDLADDEIGQPGIEQKSGEDDKPIDIQVQDALREILENNEDVTADELLSRLQSKLQGPKSRQELLDAIEPGGEDEGASEDTEVPEGAEEPESEPEGAEETEIDGDGLPADLMLHERSAAVRAEFRYNDATPAMSEWMLYQGNTPVMKVSALAAYKNDLFRPIADSEKGDYPAECEKYFDVFKHAAYGNMLVSIAQSEGIQKACAAADGVLITAAQSRVENLRGAQTLAGGTPAGTPGQTSYAGAEAGSQPVPDTSAPPMDVEGGVGEDDNTLNPSPEVEEDIQADEPDKLLIKDLIADDLASRIVNGEYTTEEVMAELTELAEEDALTEFQGMLEERVESMKEDAAESADEEAEDALTAETSGEGLPGEEIAMEAPMDASMGAPAAGANAPMPVTAARDEELEQLRKENADLKAENSNMAEERSMRFRVAQSLKLVEQMQKRGMIETFDDLKQAQAGTPDEQVQAELDRIVNEEAKKIAKMSDADYKILEETVLRTPLRRVVAKVAGNTVPDGSEIAENPELRKQASMFAGTPIYLEREERLGLDAIFPSDMFKTRRTEVAEKFNRERGIHRRR